MRLRTSSSLPRLLLAALLLSPAAVLFAGEARGDTVVFSDTFASNPATSGQWRIYRHGPDAGNESSWDSGAGVLYLTRAANGKATAIFADHALTAKQWTATFDYKVGGGTGGSSGGDGFTFMFYKDETPYGALAPSPGNRVGFMVTSGADSSGDLSLVPALGYGIEFRAHGGPDVILIKDTPFVPLASAPSAKVSDNAWHSATVEFDDGIVRVKIDGTVVLAATLPVTDATFTGVGFSAGTGSATNDHVIDNVQLSTPGSCVAFSDNFGSNPDTSGQWRIYRHGPDAGNESSWDSGAGVLYLTRAANDKATAIFANHALAAKRWTATFDYKVGGGTGADGFTFMFHKDETAYQTLKPAVGSSVGFLVEHAVSIDNFASTPVPGYGILFREFGSLTGGPHLGAPYVGLVRDTTFVSLAQAPSNDIADNAWHSARVEFDDGDVRVEIDGTQVLAATVPAISAFTGVGFSAGTGSETNHHVIDNVRISTPGWGCA